MTVQPVTGRRQGSAASLVRYRLGGREYPLRSVSTCYVCQSEYRFHIESEIAQGRVFPRIHKDLMLAQPECTLSVENLREHFKNGHMPSEVEGARLIMERRAIERGRSLNDAATSLADGMALAEIVVQKTIEAMQRGEIKPEIKDGIAAARLMETFAPVEQGVNANVYAEAFMAYHETAQQIMTEGQFEDFGRQLSSNVTLKSLIARYSEGEPDSEVEADSDGELVEST